MANEKQQTQSSKSEEEKICGIVMPISAIDDCSIEHWSEVKTILMDAISSAGYEANLVSDSDDSGVIQKRIVQNLYYNKIVVCDVSCKNPNVMFELGMRLAFDKPTIIVMDDKTNYSFDTSIIEHLTYPRDLSYFKIVGFKEKLKNKIQGTVKKASQPGYTTFLKNFGQFTIAKIENIEGSLNEAVLSKLDDLSRQIFDVRNSQQTIYRNSIINKYRNDLYYVIQKSINEFYEKYGIDKNTMDSNMKRKLYQYVMDHMDKSIADIPMSELIQMINSALK